MYLVCHKHSLQNDCIVESMYLVCHKQASKCIFNIDIAQINGSLTIKTSQGLLILMKLSSLCGFEFTKGDFSPILVAIASLNIAKGNH